MFEKKRKEIAKRRAEIRALLDGDGEVDMDALERELDDMDKEERELDRREAATRRLNGGAVPGHSDPGSGNGDPTPGPVNPITGRGAARGEVAGGGLPVGVDARAARMADLQGIGVEDVEARAQRFATEHRMEITTGALCRSLTLSEGNIAQPTRVSGINPGQNIVSGIVDMVRVVDADGMGEDSVAYEVSGGQTAGTKKDDGAATAATDPTLKIAKITPTLVTTLSYVSRNIQRTTPLNYQERVSAGALNALRAKTGTLIVKGDPAADIPEPTGILKAAAIQDGTDIEITAIDATTLRKIALKYGGAKNVEGGGVLLLNKDDLIAFGDVRGGSEKKAIYEIKFSEQSTTTGTIKEGGLAVKFCIVDDLPALSASGTAATTYCMAYGKPLTYQLDLFGPYTVEVSRDYKFAEGLLAVMGEAMIGGNVVTENGFIRVKKKAGT
ncbi:phage major capsid protein [Lawsonibacter sp. LCP25S3_G6]|uniref:phage major capsid protein n=1 Tax=unclassified Lawsonibacter TaxID=2617946 RepID=UPI003F94A9AC